MRIKKELCVEKQQHIGNFVTTDGYWDCGCDSDYIRCKADTLYCPKCKQHENEMPDSRLEEVLGLLEEANKLNCEFCDEEDCDLPAEEHIIIPDARQMGD